MRALLAEDDEKLGRLVKNFLEEENFSADWVKSGAEALYYASNAEYDIVIPVVMRQELFLPFANNMKDKVLRRMTHGKKAGDSLYNCRILRDTVANAGSGGPVGTDSTGKDRRCGKDPVWLGAGRVTCRTDQ